MSHLIAYILAFFAAMSPAKNHAPPFTPAPGETPAAVESRFKAIAGDIAAITLDPAEPPLYSGELGRERGALLLAALAWEESGLRADVDAGDCHRGDRRGDSDSCGAFSLWQIHTSGGLVLDGTTFRLAAGQPRQWLDAHPNVIKGDDLKKSRSLAALVALHMARLSIDNWTRGKAAKGDAYRWWAAHPY